MFSTFERKKWLIINKEDTLEHIWYLRWCFRLLWLGKQHCLLSQKPFRVSRYWVLSRGKGKRIEKFSLSEHVIIILYVLCVHQCRSMSGHMSCMSTHIIEQHCWLCMMIIEELGVDYELSSCRKKIYYLTI